MNKLRRKAIGRIISRLQDITSDIQDILEDEDNARDNMPENLESSDRYDLSQYSSDLMEESIENINSAMSALEEI